MQKKYFKNSIISFILIVTTISMPLSFIPKKAEAQSISGYAGGLSGAILALPQCLGKNINDGVKGLFSSSETTALKNNSALGDIDPLTGESYGASDLNATANSAASQLDSIQVHDKTTYNEVIKQGQKLSKLEKETSSINNNSTCIQSIGRLMIKMLLQKLTMSTVEWINSGFDGSPSFIQDPGKFFNDIAKTEILQFGLEINNPKLFPFGKAWMQNTAAAFNNKFQDNARYSLDEMIQQTNPSFSAQTFQQDFSQGGWDAWTAMTQVPANNPLGFQLMASNELQKRLEGTTQSTAQNVHEALAQANGFLGDMRCKDDPDITQTQATAALKETPQRKLCPSGFEYVTPGSMVASAATNVMGYQNNAYLNVQDLNDAVAAIIDSLLGKFSNNIYEKGFVNIGNEGADGTLVLDNSYNPIDSKSQTQKDYMPSQLSSSWLQANPDFDIRTDLTQALIDEQRTYSDKLAQQNKELISTTDGKNYEINKTTGISNTYGLIPVIYQLDYCIPGPHPGWEEDSRQALAAATNTIVPETVESTKDKTMEAVIGSAKAILPISGAAVGALVLGPALAATLSIVGSAVPVVGTIVGALVGTLLGFVASLFGGDDTANVRAYYSTIIRGFTGYFAPYDNENDNLALNLESKAGAVNVLNTILDRYTVIMKIIYTPDILPAVTTEANTTYEQLPGYYQMIKDNTDKISLLNNVVNTLGDIKNKVDELNTTYPNKGSDYEDALKAQINAFGRLSASMVNGDDIASANNLLKQIQDKRDYIYKNLLKGPYGCEADLEKPQQKFAFPFSASSDDQGIIWNEFVNDRWDNFDANSVRRMTYPFPIIYDYNKLAKSVEIPDPWNSKFVNHMPATTSDKYGPGFLSFISYTASQQRRGPERLKVYDILPDGNKEESRRRSLGITAGDPQSGPFETMIGIY